MQVYAVRHQDPISIRYIITPWEGFRMNNEVDLETYKKITNGV